MISSIFRNLTIGLLASVSLLLIPGQLLAQNAENIRWSSSFTVEPNGLSGRLNITADIDLGFHIYGTKKIHDEIPTNFSIEKDFSGVKISGDFEPDTDAIVAFDPAINTDSTYFEGMVTWTAPVEFDPTVGPAPTSIPIKISFQICNAKGCNLINSKTNARLVGAIASGVVFRPESAHASFSGSLAPKTVRPGNKVTLRIEANPDDGWRIPALIDDRSSRAEDDGAKPTIVVLNKTNGWNVSDVTTEQPAGSGGPVWIVSVDVPSSAQSKTYSLGGLVAFDALSETEPESTPATFGFKVDLLVGDQTIEGESLLSFDVGPSYKQVQEIRTSRLEVKNARAGQFANYNISTVMGLALLAGFILNFMPCVLPVIGLKIMSFVQQAGENPRRVFLLNLAFAFGVMAVFMLLAFVATRPAGGGWGGLFQSDRFQIVMIGIVFAFALSFLGVWEIPIPGMSGSGIAGALSAKEGFFGAFVKGIITTLLATPCSGPLLVPTVVWALAQPPLLTYLTFAAMGLGMALPYIVIGAFPKLVGVLPRPGNWMVIFKQIMGFAMLGAAIFLFGTLKEKLGIPTLSMLLAIGIASWIIGNTSIAAERMEKFKAWTYGLSIVAIGCWIAFFVLIPAHELEWNTFSKVMLKEKLVAGNIVFIDFTADW